MNLVNKTLDTNSFLLDQKTLDTYLDTQIKGVLSDIFAIQAHILLESDKTISIIRNAQDIRSQAVSFLDHDIYKKWMRRIGKGPSTEKELGYLNPENGPIRISRVSGGTEAAIKYHQYSRRSSEIKPLDLFPYLSAFIQLMKKSKFNSYFQNRQYIKYAELIDTPELNNICLAIVTMTFIIKEISNDSTPGISITNRNIRIRNESKDIIHTSIETKDKYQSIHNVPYKINDINPSSGKSYSPFFSSKIDLDNINELIHMYTSVIKQLRRYQAQVLKHTEDLETKFELFKEVTKWLRYNII